MFSRRTASPRNSSGYDVNRGNVNGCDRAAPDGAHGRPTLLERIGTIWQLRLQQRRAATPNVDRHDLLALTPRMPRCVCLSRDRSGLCRVGAPRRPSRPRSSSTELPAPPRDGRPSRRDPGQCGRPSRDTPPAHGPPVCEQKGHTAVRKGIDPRRRRSLLAAAGAATLVLTGAGFAGAYSASAATAGCRVVYTVTSQWQGGFGANVTITNLGDAVTGWTLTWSFGAGQTVTQAWNATVTQCGARGDREERQLQRGRSPPTAPCRSASTARGRAATRCRRASR